MTVYRHKSAILFADEAFCIRIIFDISKFSNAKTFKRKNFI